MGVRGRLARGRTAGAGRAAHEYEYDSSSAGGSLLRFGAEPDGFANLAVALRSLSHLDPFSHTMKPLGSSLPRISSDPNVIRTDEPLTTPCAGLHDCALLYATIVSSVGPATMMVFAAPYAWE